MNPDQRLPSPLELALLQLRLLESQPCDARIADLQLLLSLKAHGPQTAERLEKRLGVSNSSISRMTRRLGDQNRKGGSGFGLIKRTKDPAEGRRHLICLSREGAELVQHLPRPQGSA